MKLFPVVISALGVFLAIIGCSVNWQCSSFSPVGPLFDLLSNKGYMDFTINNGIVIPGLNLCDKITLQLIDKGIIEMFGASGANFGQEGSAAFQSVYSGHLFHSVQIIHFGRRLCRYMRVRAPFDVFRIVDSVHGFVHELDNSRQWLISVAFILVDVGIFTSIQLSLFLFAVIHGSFGLSSIVYLHRRY